MDARSTTSLEDVASLAPSALLYRAAQARHLVVMLEALALGADVNWHRPAPAGGGVGGAEGKSGGGGAGETALIKAVQSVSGGRGGGKSGRGDREEGAVQSGSGGRGEDEGGREGGG